MWVLSMINLPTLVQAFLYAVSWSEEWGFFSDKLPTFQLWVQEDTSQGLVWPWCGRAVLLLCLMDLLGLPWPLVWLWHFMSASMEQRLHHTPLMKTTLSALGCLFPCKVWTRKQTGFSRITEAAPEGNSGKHCSAVSIQGKEHLKIRKSRRN